MRSVLKPDVGNAMRQAKPVRGQGCWLAALNRAGKRCRWELKSALLAHVMFTPLAPAACFWLFLSIVWDWLPHRNSRSWSDLGGKPAITTSVQHVKKLLR